jgi:hypothetical protein
MIVISRWVYNAAGDNGSTGHGSNGSPKLDGSYGSWVSRVDPLTHKSHQYYKFVDQRCVKTIRLDLLPISHLR